MYYSQTEYWQAALESGMIDIATLRAEMDMTERKKLLTGHKIYQDKKNFWYTRLDNRLVKRTTKEAIEDLIVEYEPRAVLISFETLDKSSVMDTVSIFVPTTSFSPLAIAVFALYS